MSAPPAPLRSTAVFTPGEYPSHTYVARRDTEIESTLKDALETPGEIVSISGPSKSGKTVLVERVAGHYLIPVTGAGIKSPSDLWGRVLDWINAPVTSAKGTNNTASLGVVGKTEVSGGIPGLIGAKGGIDASGLFQQGTSFTETRTRRGLQDVVKEIAKSGFIILIDDFHYMPRDVQIEVAKEIKEAARLGVKICTASVPHRADDVVRGNPELRGRLQIVNVDYWKLDELVSIGEVGFPKLNANISRDNLLFLAKECSGSPQLMQALCLDLCFNIDLREQAPTPRQIQLGGAQLQAVLEKTSSRTDFSSLVARLHRGPKTRGTERKEYKLCDGSMGDVYRVLLLSLKQDPSRLSYDYKEYTNRVNHVCIGGETPQPQSVYQSFEQMSRMALDMYPDQRILEWDDSEYLLDIVDPYFVFYLRWSNKLASMANDAD